MIINRNIVVLFLCTGCSVTPLYNVSVDDCSASKTEVKAIHGRDGQILRAELKRLISSFPNSLSGYTIYVDLERTQEPIAYDLSGSANMLVTQYVADVTVNDTHNHVLVMHDKLQVSDGVGISGSPGEIISSIYTDNEKSLLKKLAYKIFNRIDVGCKKSK